MQYIAILILEIVPHFQIPHQTEYGAWRYSAGNGYSLIVSMWHESRGHYLNQRESAVAGLLIPRLWLPVHWQEAIANQQPRY